MRLGTKVEMGHYGSLDHPFSITIGSDGRIQSVESDGRIQPVGSSNEIRVAPKCRHEIGYLDGLLSGIVPTITIGIIYLWDKKSN